MKLIEKERKKLGIKKFKIQIFKNNKAAIKIYKKFGYKKIFFACNGKKIINTVIKKIKNSTDKFAEFFNSQIQEKKCSFATQVLTQTHLKQQMKKCGGFFLCPHPLPLSHACGRGRGEL